MHSSLGRADRGSSMARRLSKSSSMRGEATREGSAPRGQRARDILEPVCNPSRRQCLCRGRLPSSLAATLGELFEFERHASCVQQRGGSARHGRALTPPHPARHRYARAHSPGMAYAAISMAVGREQLPVILSPGDAVADRLGTRYRIAKPCALDQRRQLVQRALEERDPLHPEQLATQGAPP
jgi:hypothetical protein